MNAHNELPLPIIDGKHILKEAPPLQFYRNKKGVIEMFLFGI